MRHRKTAFAAVLFLAALLGCGGGEKSDWEKGMEALDSQDWETAIAIFSAMPPSTQRDKYLSSAYAGAAGLDLIELAVQVSEAQENGGNANTVVFQVASTLLHPVDGTVANAVLDTKIGYLTDAVEVYIEGFDALPAPIDLAPYGFSDEQKIQIGLETAVLAQFKIMSGLGVPGSAPPRVFVDPAALAQYLTDNTLTVADVFTDVSGDFLDNAIGLVEAAAGAIAALNPGANDIEAELDNFLNTVGFTSDQVVNGSDLLDYLDTVLGTVP